jgi:hypothetical protein
MYLNENENENENENANANDNSMDVDVKLGVDAELDLGMDVDGAVEKTGPISPESGYAQMFYHGSYQQWFCVDPKLAALLAQATAYDIMVKK